MINRYYIRSDRARPQYWTLVKFLFDDCQNVDTDGDSIPSTSTEWTWVSIRKRNTEQQVVEIYVVLREPMVLVVESTTGQLAARAAYYLAKTMGTAVLGSETGPELDFQTIEATLGNDFDIANAWQRVNG